MEYRGRGVSEVAVIGRACRLPGAASVARLWDLLRHERCAVRQIPDDRWSLERFGHPRRGEPGRSYTWSAGVLDDIWGFDAAAFGISPREAEQMDPQQRLLLELVQEALDDGGIAASTLAGKDIGVFVGASALDHGNSKLFDIAAGDAYFATGNTLSLISNRVSYIYDLRGPSMTIDTACSSSLVALHQATSAIRSGQIKTAIVAGVNILASPFSFIGFSRAAMLSATGLCHSFGDGADGYVRAEGGVVLVLRALPEALAARNEIHALVLATGTNSDGRTTGVAFPSAAAQAGLLTRIYGDHHIDPDDLAFVEAHGTGTRVGDPAEARAMGETLGRKRERPLPIGSIKSNIGHLEPASGLAGVLKCMLALEHNMLPPSLHCDVPNRDIPFEELNLEVATRPRPLLHGRDMLAGISSFGFGGTNAHAVIGRAPTQLSRSTNDADRRRQDQIVLLSAHSTAALADLAEAFAERIADADAPALRRTVAALAHRRDRAAFRAAILATDRDEIIAALGEIADDDAPSSPAVVVGRAVEPHARTAFVYSGNGSQWSGMGRAAFEHNAVFRDSFGRIDAIFAPLAGWKLADRLFSPDLDRQLPMTSIAQPLIFAIQAAATETLAAMGLRPDVVLGHSVGEIAAAHACGLLSTESAVRVVLARSRHQELARLKGRMAVVFAGEEATRALLDEHPDVEIAAFNSPGAFTVSGAESALERMAAAAAATGIKVHFLDLDYPFHCAAMDVVREPLLADLAGLRPGAAATAFISTVDPDDERPSLDADYWWRNVREPVQFAQGLRRAVGLGTKVFVEIGPRSTLLRHIVDTFSPSGTRIACIGSLERDDAKDPFPRVLASALVRGARVSPDAIAGPDPGPGIALPAYPWQRKTFRLAETSESLAVLNPPRIHPLIGARLGPDATEWSHHIDALRIPELADHVVGGAVILPGAAFLEMMWAASMEWRGAGAAAVADAEIVQPLVLNDGVSVEVRTRIAPETGVIEIASRLRLSGAPWALHAKGKSIEAAGPGRLPPRQTGEPESVFEADDIYGKAHNVRLDYGPAFRKVARTIRYAEDRLAVELVAAADSPAFGMAPWQLDACFHGIVSLFEKGQRKNDTFIPVRFGDSRLERPGRAVARADIAIKTSDDRKMIADFVLYDAENAVIAVLRDARFQVRPDDARPNLRQQWIVTPAVLPPLGETPPALAEVAFDHVLSGIAVSETSDPDAPDSSPDSLLREGWATALALRLAATIAGGDNVDIAELLARKRIGPRAAPWLARLLEGLEACQLARRVDGGYLLMPDSSLPDDGDVLRAIAAEYPQHPAELLAASQLAQAVGRIDADDCDLFEDDSGFDFSMGALAEYGACAQRAARSVTRMLENVVSHAPAGKALRILLLGAGRAFPAACERAAAHGAGKAERMFFLPGPVEAINNATPLFQLVGGRLADAAAGAGDESDTLFGASHVNHPNFVLKTKECCGRPMSCPRSGSIAESRRAFRSGVVPVGKAFRFLVLKDVPATLRSLPVGAAGNEAAIDHEVLGRDERRSVRDQEADKLGHLFDPSASLHGRHVDHRLHERRGAIEIGYNHSGADGVHANAVLHVFHGCRLGETAQRPFARAVRGVEMRRESGIGSNIYDGALARRHHRPGAALDPEERSGDVDRHYPLPFGEIGRVDQLAVDDARIVDQDIEARVTVHRLRDHGVPVFGTGDIEAAEMNVHSLTAKVGSSLLSCFFEHVTDQHSGAATGEVGRLTCSLSTRSARDDRDTASEIVAHPALLCDGSTDGDPDF